MSIRLTPSPRPPVNDDWYYGTAGFPTSTPLVTVTTPAFLDNNTPINDDWYYGTAGFPTSASLATVTTLTVQDKNSPTVVPWNYKCALRHAFARLTLPRCR